MDNPIKYSEFIQPDQSVSNLIVQLEQLQKQYTELEAKIRGDADNIAKALKNVNSATEKGRATTRKSATEADKLGKAYDDLSKSQSATAKEIAALKLMQQKQNNVNKLTIKFNKAVEGSYDKLSAEYSLNKIKLNAMSKEQRTATKAGQQLEKQTKEIYEEMKRLQEATGKHTLSVGDYKKGWSGVTDQLSEVPGAAGSAASGLKGVSASMKALLANPIVLVLAAIIGGFTALFGLFKKTKAGSDLLAKGGAILSGIMSALVGVVYKLFKGLMSVFEDPQQAMKDFWEALKKNIVNRIIGVILLVKALGKAFKSLWELDLQGLKDAAGEAGTALVQMGTGLDEKQQKEFAEAVRETTQAIYDQAAAFAALEESRLKVRRANRELEKSVERLITQEELAKAVADDATKSFAEREAAAEKAAALTEKRAKLQQMIASSNLSLINREIDLRKKNGEDVEALLDKQLDAYKALKQAQRDYLLSVRDNQKRESELKQDRLEKDLDILIDAFDNQKTINERIIADDSRTFKERQAKLSETKKLFEDTFAKQIETIQRFTGVQLNANDLINESDAVVLNQKIRALGLSEIIEGRMLEIIRERRTATQDLADAEKDLTDKKAAADKKALDEAKKAQKEKLDASIEVANQEYDLELSRIDLLKATEAEKTRLRLEAERDRIQKILDLNKKAGGDLSDLQIKTMKNTIAKINQEIDKAGSEGGDLYDKLGIKLNDDQKQALSDSATHALDIIQTVLDAKLEAADAALEKAEEETSSAESKVEREIEARNNGYANNVIGAQRELELAKKKEADRLKEKKKAQKAQAIIDTAMQISSLITATAELWKSNAGIPIIGAGLATAATALMWGSFAASKIKAATAAKEKFGDGGLEFLKGGSHASGNDIPIGTTDSGKQRTAEGGEAMAIINRKNTRKYKSALPGIIKSLNSGTFEKAYSNSFVDENNKVIFAESNSDFSNMENSLEAIRRNGEKRTYIDGEGRLVEVYKNIKRVYV